MKDKTLKRLAVVEAREPAVEDDGAARERLMARYETISARRRAQENWTAPPEAECVKIAREFIEYMRLAHGAVPLGP
jgi:hypothetical protein